jgi:transcriptional regulator with XRE-family HTH domain
VAVPKQTQVSSLPDFESAICSRFREARESAGIKQRVAAELLGLALSRYKTYEYAASPVPFAVAEMACRSWNINQRWLATGKFPKHPHFDIEVPLVRILEEHCKGRRISFGTVYREVLSALFDGAFKRLKSENNWPMADASTLSNTVVKPNMPPLGAGQYSSRHFEAANLGKIVQGAAERLPEKVLPKFDAGIKRLVAEILDKHRVEIELDTAELIPQLSREWVAWETFVSEKLRRSRRS